MWTSKQWDCERVHRHLVGTSEENGIWRDRHHRDRYQPTHLRLLIVYDDDGWSGESGDIDLSEWDLFVMVIIDHTPWSSSCNRMAVQAVTLMWHWMGNALYLLIVSTRVCLCVYVSVCPHGCFSLYMCACVCVCLCLCVSMSVCFCVCVSVYLYVCVFVTPYNFRMAAPIEILKSTTPLYRVRGS